MAPSVCEVEKFCLQTTVPFLHKIHNFWGMLKSVLFTKVQKRDAFCEDWIWLEAKKKLTSVLSLPHMVFPALMICVRIVWAVAS